MQSDRKNEGPHMLNKTDMTNSETPQENTKWTLWNQN